LRQGYRQRVAALRALQGPSLPKAAADPSRPELADSTAPTPTKRPSYFHRAYFDVMHVVGQAGPQVSRFLLGWAKNVLY